MVLIGITCRCVILKPVGDTFRRRLVGGVVITATLLTLRKAHVSRWHKREWRRSRSGPVRARSIVSESAVSQVRSVGWRSLVGSWGRGQCHWQLQGGCGWENGCRSVLNGWRVRGLIKERCIFAKQRLPLRPIVRRCEEVVLHVAEKFNLHNVNLSNVDSRDFGPGFVRIGVVVQKFVSQHQSNSQKPILASRLAFYAGVEFLQAVDEQQSQEYNVLGYQRRGKNRSDPFAKASRRCRIFDQFSGRGERYWRFFDLF